MFSCEFCKISKNNFFTEHLWTTASVHCSLKSWFINNCQTILRDSWILYFAVFEKHIIPNMNYFSYAISGKKNYTNEDLWEQFNFRKFTKGIWLYITWPTNSQIEMLWNCNIGFSLILDYLSRSKQRTKIGSSYSSWYDIVKVFPQGWILWFW